jgi:hypothetical protein
MELAPVSVTVLFAIVAFCSVCVPPLPIHMPRVPSVEILPVLRTLLPRNWLPLPPVATIAALAGYPVLLTETFCSVEPVQRSKPTPTAPTLALSIARSFTTQLAQFRTTNRTELKPPADCRVAASARKPELPPDPVTVTLFLSASTIPLGPMAAAQEIVTVPPEGVALIAACTAAESSLPSQRAPKALISWANAVAPQNAAAAHHLRQPDTSRLIAS